MPQPTIKQEDEKCPFPQFSKECLAFHKGREQRKQQRKQGIDFSKDNIYDGIGRPDLKPVINSKNWEEEFDEKFTDTCDNWIPLLNKEDGSVKKDIMFEPEDIKQFISDLHEKDEKELTKYLDDNGYRSPNLKGMIHYYYNK